MLEQQDLIMIRNIMKEEIKEAIQESESRLGARLDKVDSRFDKLEAQVKESETIF